jgi:hypothetical protein
MWLRVLFITLLCSSGAAAQQLSFGAQIGLTLNFAQPSSPIGLLTAEARGLVSGLGVRGSLGFSDAFEIALDGLYRFDGSDYGNLYVGLGLGASRSAEFRVLLGYEWDIGSSLRVCAESIVRVPFSSDPRLSFAFGLVYLL